MTISYRILNPLALVCFLVEVIGIESSLVGANTPLCWVPPPETYDGFRIANVFSFIGAILISIKLSIDTIHMIKKQMIYDRKSFWITSLLPTNLLVFHISFFFPSIFGSVGCNPIPERFIIPIGITWLIPNFSYFIAQIIIRLIYISKNKKKIKPIFMLIK
ncbi:MAG: hypothetical protein ACFFCG_01960 [Promethearchaeota archaeon]